MWDVQALHAPVVDWSPLLAEFMRSASGLQLIDRLKTDAATHSIFPCSEHVFRALTLTTLANVRVVILGQDPYHGLGQADGLAFSVPRGVAHPPSLRNILRELREDIGEPIPNKLDLSDWASQGVLLLNTTLTVRQDAAGSHRGFGWEALTDQLIQQINQQDRPVVFVLWGKDAQNKLSQVDRQKHLTICSPHPSPLSAYRGFFGSRPFSRINQFLMEHGHQPIAWV